MSYVAGKRYKAVSGMTRPTNFSSLKDGDVVTCHNDPYSGANELGLLCTRDVTWCGKEPMDDEGWPVANAEDLAEGRMVLVEE